MNAATTLANPVRAAASPYARRLASERNVALGGLTGSGPGGRIVAADVLAHRPPVAAPPPQPVATLPPPRPVAAPYPQVISFSAVIPLANLYDLITQAGRAGLHIAIEDIVAKAAVSVAAGGVALEFEGRQILICVAPDLTIGAMHRQRLVALEGGADVSAEPARASLLVLQSARVVPGILPLLPGRAVRFVLVIDRARELGHALICTDSAVMTEAAAIAILDGFASALEEPLMLLA